MPSMAAAFGRFQHEPIAPPVLRCAWAPTLMDVGHRQIPSGDDFDAHRPLTVGCAPDSRSPAVRTAPDWRLGQVRLRWVRDAEANGIDVITATRPDA